jgi:hypothetical protein
MTNDLRFTGEYLEIEDDDFDEWVVGAPTNRLLDARCEYLIVIESEAKLAGESNDSTDPDTLLSLSSIVENLCIYSTRVSDVQGELYRRHAPAGHASDYKRRLWAALAGS